ncbi:hypothetical protein [Streptomyces sp. T028]|uniref:hypothetical protein n=1 Tax=Streptomyces sp. T028 TaxID=3394379 RepID=UPI003A8BF42C
MSADEVTHGTDADASRVRTGPRHAAPKKPLLARMHLPAGKAIALAAMPTAVLMGMGFTPTLARADEQPTSKSLTAEEYEACVDAMTADASASASPSASNSESASASTEDSTSDSSQSDSTDDSKDTQSGSGGSSSSDSGSDETAEPSPAASSEAASSAESSTSSGDTATAEPSATETSKNVLETIGDALTDLFDGDSSDTSTASESPSPTASASADATSSADSGTSSSDDSDSGDSTGGTAKDTTDALTDAAKEAAEDTTDTADDTAEDATETATATASPSPSESATTDVEDCPVATDEESGVDNKLPLPDDPWYLNASSLLLKGADYQGIVKVKTSGGKTKEVLKYVISGGTEIGDLHQTVIDKQAGKTYHVQAGSGTKSTIEDGDTVMYTESISGNLFGLIPVTFTPEDPPPLNIPLIYFTNVKVQQAGQFGGTLTVPGLHQYIT